MPALLSTVAEFQQSSLGAALKPYYPTATGALDLELFRASAEVDRITDRRLAVPPLSQISTTASAGDMQLNLEDVTNISQGDVLFLVNSGQTVQVRGAELTLPAEPNGNAYAGTVHLAEPIEVDLATGSPVQVYRQTFYEIRGKATNEIDDAVPMSQEGQLARMHAPFLRRGASGRTIFLESYPVIELHAAFESLPWSNTETTVDLTASYLLPEQGWYRLPVGFYNPMATIWRTQYLAGFSTIPYDLRDAVHNLLAERLMRGQNPLGASSIRSGDQAYTNPGLIYRQRALEILTQGKYIRTWR
ncbi:MAG: hypothetical protein ACRDFS_11710 [Chloroflexota bacterium]